MIRAVLDTNVLVSGLAGLASPSSTPGIIMRRWRAGVFELVVSSSILTEVEHALNKPYFRSRPSRALIDATDRSIRKVATMITPTVEVFGIAPHPEDDLVLAAAVSAQVDFLVTGDKRFLAVGSYAGVTILSPRAFLYVLETANQ